MTYKCYRQLRSFCLFVTENGKDSSGVTLLTTSTPWVLPSHPPDLRRQLIKPLPIPIYTYIEKSQWYKTVSDKSGEKGDPIRCLHVYGCIILTFRMPRAAGVYLLGTGGSIPPKSVGRATLNTRFFSNVLIFCVLLHVLTYFFYGQSTWRLPVK